MAIVRMITRERFEANVGNPNFWIDHNYPGAEAGLIRHSPACPHYHTSSHGGVVGHEIGPGYSDCVGYHDARRENVVDVNTGQYGTGNDGKVGYIAGSCSGPFEPLYMERSHIGLVLETREENRYDDSDFYAVVWNAAKGETEKVYYASTRGWTYPNGAREDAAGNVITAYNAWLDKRAAAAAAQRASAEAAVVCRGKMVEVFKGRKVPIGTTGEVFWLGVGNYGERVGLKDAAGNVHWTAKSNVRVILSK